jgi:dimethylargininase
VTVALVRAPGLRLGDGLVTHIERGLVDVDRAREQWDGYVAVLAREGFEVVEVPPSDACPDAVFVEDTLVVLEGTAVVTRPGAESRRPETAGSEDAARTLGYRVERIEWPGTLDGGDVLAGDGLLYVGVGGRTNPEGARQLASRLGVRVIEVPIAGVLHLKTAATRLPDGTYAGFPPLLRDALLVPGLRAVPEPSGANVLALGGSRLLVAGDCPRSAELFASLGFDPVVVDISELQKLEAGVTCLSVFAQRSSGR